MSNIFILILTVIMVVALIGLVLFVALSTAQRSAKVLFTSLCVSLIIWIAANTGADTSEALALELTRVAFLGAAMTLAALVLFVLWFPKKLSFSTMATPIVVAFGILLSALSLTDMIVPEVIYQDGYANVVSGSMYWFYVGYSVVGLAAAISLLGVQYKTEFGINKERVRYVMVGILITSLISAVTNLFLPLVTGKNPLAIYGSLSAVGFIGMVAYSMIHSQLFNIRVATARAVAYLLSGVTLGLIFGVIILWLDSALFADNSVDASQRVFYTLSAVLVGFTFPHIKKFFDNLTRHILLRDMYEPKEVLADITNAISKSKTTESLFRDVGEKLFSSLHLSFVDVYVIQKNKKGTRRAHIGDSSSNKITDVKDLLAATKGVSVVFDDHDPADDNHDENIGMLMFLKTTQGPLGYITIGYKQNGTTFTSDDRILLETVANELAIAAENLLRYEAIESFNETLQQRVDQATSELRASNLKLKKLDSAKDDFISMASHQLRTPLTSIKGYLSMVLDGDVGEVAPPQRKVLEEAYTSSQRMVYLIGDFLNVSRLQTGKFMLERAPVNLPQILESEIDQLQATAGPRRIKLVYDAPHDFPVLEIDENKIRQVMMNFIDNAIYYAKSGGGTIRIELAKRADHITFKVVDDGIGVPKSEQHQLFSKFYRATNARKARPDGTGIGLFMAKKVVVAHGGAILFESTEGKGSLFGFRLPLEVAASPQPTESAQQSAIQKS